MARDIDGDGLGEIVTGAGPGPVFGPHVRGFDYDGTSVQPISKVSFHAYGTLRYGVHVQAEASTATLVRRSRQAPVPA